MKKTFLVTIAFTFYFSLFSQGKSSSSLILQSICPFECCQLGQWIIKDSIFVYERDGDTSNVIYYLNYGDTVIAENGNLHFP